MTWEVKSAPRGVGAQPTPSRPGVVSRFSSFVNELDLRLSLEGVGSCHCMATQWTVTGFAVTRNGFRGLAGTGSSI